MVNCMRREEPERDERRRGWAYTASTPVSWLDTDTLQEHLEARHEDATF